MTRSVVTPRIAYSGSGSSGPFSVPFYFEDNTHILVYLIDSESESTLFVEGTHYDLTGAGTATGSVTTTDAVATGETLVIYRATPLDQDTDLVTNGTFNSVVVEDAFDKILDQMQELETRADFFNLPLSGLPPTHADNAGKFLKINAAGTALESAGGVDVSAFIPGKNCLVVSTSNITLSGLQTIDGVALAAGNIVLVTGQTTKANNGVYVAAFEAAWTRHADHDDTDGLQAMTAFGVTSGTAYASSIWVQLVLDPEIGTSDITFGRIGASIGVDDVLIAANGTLDFGAGDVVFQHSTNAVAVTGGQLTITYGAAAGSEPLRLVNSTDAASVQVAQFEGDRATPTNADTAYHSFLMSNAAGTQTEIGRFAWKIDDVTAGSEDGTLVWSTAVAGSLVASLAFNGSVLFPVINDGVALGLGIAGFSDLHLATGGVINWANGEVTLTETANALTMAGGQLVVTDSTAFTTPAGRFVNSTDSSAVLALNIEGDRATPTNNDSVVIHFKLSDSAGNQDAFAALQVVATDVASGSEDGTLVTYVAVAGTNTAKLSLTGTTLSPFANDGLALGTTTEGFSDLHLASGGVINFNNGDVSITHLANTLLFTGAPTGYYFDTDVYLTNGQLKATNSVLFSTPAGRFINASDAAANVGLSIESDRATPTNADGVSLDFKISDSAGNQDTFGRIDVLAADVTSASEDGLMRFGVVVAGTITTKLDLSSTVLYPEANDGLSLGAGGFAFSDLFLASGGVINWANGEATVTGGGNTISVSGATLKIGGTVDRGTTEGTNKLDIFDGTAPVGTLANGISFYSTSGECRVMDAAGNATLLSPHDKETNEWIYHSVDTRTGKGLKIDMERMMRAINDKFGWDFIHEFEVI